MRKTGALGLAFCLCLATLAAQQPTFKSGTQVVSLFATVTDAQKRLVPDLVQDDFEVFDNDKPQPLVFFENEVQPISVVVMLDTSGSMTLTLDLLRQAAAGVRQPAAARRPGARRRVQRQDSSSTRSSRTIAISWSPTSRTSTTATATRLWDAIAASLDELKGIEGRRVILVFTDGDDTGSRNSSLGKVIDRARAEEVMIYAIGLESQYSRAANGPSPTAGCGRSPTRPAAGISSSRRRASSPRPSLASRRSCTASTCSASRRPCSTARSTSCSCA